MTDYIKDYIKSNQWKPYLAPNRTILSDKEFETEVRDKLYLCADKYLLKTHESINNFAYRNSRDLNHNPKVRAENYLSVLDEDEEADPGIFDNLIGEDGRNWSNDFFEPRSLSAEIWYALSAGAKTDKQMNTVTKVYNVLKQYSESNKCDLSKLCELNDLNRMTFRDYMIKLRNNDYIQNFYKNYYTDIRIERIEADMIIYTNPDYIKDKYGTEYIPNIYADENYQTNKYKVKPEDRSDEHIIDCFNDMIKHCNYKAELEEEARIKAYKESLKEVM